jgi:hypothetical protein
MSKVHILSSDVQVIEPARGLRLVDPFELWRRRELFVALMVRDIAVRYKQTAIGIAWVVVQPLAMVAIFSFLLGKIRQRADRRPAISPVCLRCHGALAGVFPGADGGQHEPGKQ